MLRLKRDEVPEPDRRERDETVIERVDVRPVLEVGERGGAAEQHETRHVHRDHDEVRLGHLEVLHLQTLLHRLQHERHEDVEALADALEHDEIERDADERVEHAEDLAADGARRTVAVACNGEHTRVTGWYPGTSIIIIIIKCNIWHLCRSRTHLSFAIITISLPTFDTLFV